MSIIYVDSNAVGLNDGSSWANAYTGIQAALTAWTTADVIYVAHNHSEYATVGTGNWTWTATNDAPDTPVPIISVNSGTDAYAPQTDGSTQFQCTGSINWQFACIWYGGYFESNTNFNIGTASMGGVVFRDCYFKADKTTAGNMYLSLADTSVRSLSGEFSNCTFDSECAATVAWIMSCRGTVVFRGCSFASDNNMAGSGGLFSADVANDRVDVFVDGCDFTGWLFSSTSLVYTNSDIPNYTSKFVNCSVPASTTFINGTVYFGDRHEFIGIDDAGDVLDYQLYEDGNSIVQDTAVYRDSGFVSANDRSTQLSHKITTASDIDRYQPFYGPWMHGVINSTGSKTFTVEIAHTFTAALKDSEIWLEIQYLGTASETEWVSATDALQVSGALQDPIGTGANQDTSTEAWTGAGSYTFFQKLSVTKTIAVKGPFRARVCCAAYEAAKVINYDPMVTVS